MLTNFEKKGRKRGLTLRYLSGGGGKGSGHFEKGKLHFPEAYGQATEKGEHTKPEETLSTGE